VTLVVAVTGPKSIWLLADRRLSRKGRRPTDDGRKVMFLNTTDGSAILAYAGLGATALGTEPADWMGTVLRGRNLPLEQSLGVLAETMQRQLPRHLIRMPPNRIAAHHVIVPAFLDGEPRLYSIELVFAPDRQRYWFRYTRHVHPLTGAPPRIGIGGSSALRLNQDSKWMRNLVRMVRAHERGNVSLRAVADHLAALNEGGRGRQVSGTTLHSCVALARGWRRPALLYRHQAGRWLPISAHNCEGDGCSGHHRSDDAVFHEASGCILRRRTSSGAKQGRDQCCAGSFTPQS
jgi:hypothetical protein